MKLILLGPPGAGKGTLANLIKESLNVLHISTGDLLREEVKNSSDLGKEVKGYIERGELVPDEVVTKMVAKKLSDKELFEKGFMLDGFPRTKAQAEDLDKILKNVGQDIDFALYMETSLPVILKRLTGRRVCRNCKAVYHVSNRPPKQEGVCDVCGSTDLYQRPDDNEETITNRMAVYTENTQPIVDYYEQMNKLKKVDGDKESEDLQEELLKMLDG